MLRLKSLQKSWSSKLKEVARDYKSAAEGTVEAAKLRPFRATFYTASTVFGLVAFKTTPSNASYIAKLVESSNELLLCGSERSKYADDYVQSIFQRWAKGMLRYTHCGLFSIVYFAEHNFETKSFKATCKYGNPRWKDMPNYVIDFGFLGRWWKLNYVMTDFDVDFSEIPKEYKHVLDKYYDVLRTSFGYSYFNNLKAQSRSSKLYVETVANDATALSD